MKKLSPAEPPPPSHEPDSILGQHHANLGCLSTELDGLQRLSDRWCLLATQLESAEAEIADTVTELLSGEATDTVFNERSIRIASLQAQRTALFKRLKVSGAALQERLPKDIAATEWLCANWLQYRLQTEVAKLLETAAEAKRGLVREAAFALAEAGIAYGASQSELKPPAPVSWAWQRPIESQTDKNLSRLSAMVADPLWQAPEPRETIQNLLDAAKAQQARWISLLSAIGTDPAFIAPSYEEPKSEVWTPTPEQAGIISGPPRAGLPALPATEQQVKMCWSPADLLTPPWEQSKAG